MGYQAQADCQYLVGVCDQITWVQLCLPPIQPAEEAEVVQTFQLVLHSTEHQSLPATNIQFMLAVSGNMRWNAALINSSKPGQWHILFGQLRDKCPRCGWTATRVKQMASEMA